MLSASQPLPMTVSAPPIAIPVLIPHNTNALIMEISPVRLFKDSGWHPRHALPALPSHPILFPSLDFVHVRIEKRVVQHSAINHRNCCRGKFCFL